MLYVCNYVSGEWLVLFIEVGLIINEVMFDWLYLEFSSWIVRMCILIYFVIVICEL